MFFNLRPTCTRHHRMLALLMGLVFIFSSINAIVDVHAAGNVLFKKFGNHSSSAYYSDEINFPKNNTIDENENSFWRTSDGDQNRWMAINLEGVTEINQFVIKEFQDPENNNKGNVTGYEIAFTNDEEVYSDGNDERWTTVYVGTTIPSYGADIRNSDFLPPYTGKAINARYVRFKFTSVEDESNTKISITELQAYTAINMTAVVREPIKGPENTIIVKPTLQNEGLPVFSDVEQNEVISEITGFGIMKGYEDGTFRPENNLTRAEFAAVLTRLLGLGEMAANPVDTHFHDVDATNMMSGYIYAMYQMGYIIGDNAGNFHPDDNVTYEQAMKMLVSVLGYQHMAELRGGYPYGYITTATELHLSDGMGEIALDAPLTRSQIALAVYNALEVDLMEPTALGSTEAYGIKQGKTLLTEMLDAVKIDGLVDATKESGSPGSVGLRYDQILVDGVAYAVGTTNAKEYLGYSVTLYYSEENGERIIKLIYPQRGRNEELVINADEIVESSVSVIRYAQKDSDRVRTARIEPTARVYYNGKFVDSYRNDMLHPFSGNVTLVDTSGAGDYGSIFVNEGVDVTINGVNTEDKIMIDRYLPQSNVQMDNKAMEAQMLLIKDGEEIEFEDLAVWDVVTVYADTTYVEELSLNTDNAAETYQRKFVDSTNSTVIKAVVNTAMVTGEIVEILNDNQTIVIRSEAAQESDQEGEAASDEETEPTTVDTEYELSDAYYHYLLSQNQLPAIGDVGEFRLNADGKIAAIKWDTALSDNYGFVLDFTMEKGLEEKITLALLTLDNELKELELDEKVRVNGGVRVESNQEMLIKQGLLTQALNDDGTPQVPETYEFNPQLIVYNENSEGKMSELYTAVQLKEGESSKDYKLVLSHPYKNRKYINTQRFQDCLVDANTRVLQVPVDGAIGAERPRALGLEYASYYSIISATTITNYSNIYVEGFNADEKIYVPVMVEYVSATGNLSANSDWMVFERFSQGLDSNGATVPIIRGYEKGVPVSIIVADDNKVVENMNSLNLQLGDVIRYGTNKMGELTSIAKMFTPSNPTMSAPEDFTNRLQTVYGPVTEMLDDVVILNVSGVDVPFRVDAGTYFYEVDTDPGARVNIKSITKDNIIKGEDGTIVFMRLNSAKVKEVVVYKNNSVKLF